MSHKILSHIEKFIETLSDHRLQYLIFTGLSLGILGIVTILNVSNQAIFRRFLGSINPILAFLMAIIMGFICLTFLISNAGMAIFKGEYPKTLLCFFVLATLLSVIMILVDVKIHFPADTNIFFPESVLFYPAIGFFAEILFHVIPLTALLFLLNPITRNASPDKVIWICIFLISLLEPVYQAIDMASSNHYPVWSVIYVGLHIFCFNFLQLVMFKRYDFVSMYSFRLVYYLFWHIVWGYLRLSLLF